MFAVIGSHPFGVCAAFLSCETECARNLQGIGVIVKLLLLTAYVNASDILIAEIALGGGKTDISVVWIGGCKNDILPVDHFEGTEIM